MYNGKPKIRVAQLCIVDVAEQTNNRGNNLPLFGAEGGLFAPPPPQVFPVPLPNAARWKAHTRLLFLNIIAHILTTKKKLPGQVRLPEAFC